MIIAFGGLGFLGRHLAARVGAREPLTVVARSADAAFFDRFAPDADFMTLSEFDGPEGAARIGRARAVVWFAGATVPSSNPAEPWNELGQTINPLWRGVDRIMSVNPSIRFIFPSSGGAVYGTGRVGPTPEDAPLNPISAYGLGKVMAEHVIRWTARKAGAECVTLRIANPIGRWQRDDRQGIAGIALRALATDSPVTLFDRGRQVRDFFDADDMAELFLKVATWPGPLDGVWNAGSGRGVTVAEMIDLVARAYGRSPRIDWAPARPGDIDYAVVDPSRVARDFGWRAETPLEDTVARMVAASRGPV